MGEHKQVRKKVSIMGKVVTILKKKKEDNPGNYRPVNLTLIPRQILEQIVKQSIYNHLEEQKAVGSDQRGFVKSKLCQANLISSYDRVTGHADKGKAIDAISADFSHTFDSSPHDILINRRGRYSLDRTVIS